MAFDPRRLWQISLLEVAGIVTFTLSVVLIAGIVLIR